MIGVEGVRLMARYNRWQNESLYAVAGSLSDAQRRAARGAFFGSIHATLNHLLWADRIWMSRFTGAPRPAGTIAESVALHEGWDELRRERDTFDQAILDWADALLADWLDGDLTYYSGASGRELTRPRALAVMHLFNHQTHHRGQVHCLLTQAGARTHVTDLVAMPRQAERPAPSPAPD